MEFAELTLLDPEGKPLALPDMPYYIDIRFNDAGNRDIPRTKRKPPGVFRVGCVGDSYTWGAGALFDDLFTRRLEELLASEPPLANCRYEVLNFGVGGSAPGEELQEFKEYDLDFDLDLVLATLCFNDGMERGQIFDLLNAYKGPPERAWKEVLQEGERLGFQNCLNFLAQMQAICRDRNIRFAVATFQNFDGRNWEQLDVEVGPALAAHGTPYWNARQALISAGVWGEAALAMELFDNHPSAAAHRAYAQGLRDFFLEHGLLTPRHASPDPQTVR